MTQVFSIVFAKPQRGSRFLSSDLPQAQDFRIQDPNLFLCSKPCDGLWIPSASTALSRCGMSVPELQKLKAEPTPKTLPVTGELLSSVINHYTLRSSSGLLQSLKRTVALVSRLAFDCSSSRTATAGRTSTSPSRHSLLDRLDAGGAGGARCHVGQAASGQALSLRALCEGSSCSTQEGSA